MLVCSALNSPPQARCLQCRELLEPAAVACVECGTPVGKRGEASGNGATTPVPPPIKANRNTLSFQEDRNSRRFEASLTDSAMQNLGDVFGELFAQRGLGRVHKEGATRFFSKEQPGIEAPKQLPPPADVNGVAPQASPAASSPAQLPDLTRISGIFRANGEILELIENRLKAKSGMDYVRRLTYLFLYAHELHGREWTPRAGLIAVLKEGKGWDTNAGHWLKKKQGFRVDPDDRFQLIQSGRDQAKKALPDALDPNLTDDWHPDTKVVVKRGPRKKKV